MIVDFSLVLRARDGPAWVYWGFPFSLDRTTFRIEADMRSANKLLDSGGVDIAIKRLTSDIAKGNSKLDFALVGIQKGGVCLANRLGQLLGQRWGQDVPIGYLDVSMHRDDLDRRAAPDMQPTQIPFDVTGKHIVLVDDVLCSGRTIRAAMDALNDLGRPKKVQLAVLVDRGHLELPIRADYVGTTVDTAPSDRVNVQFKEEGGEEAVFLETA